jgi:hypothetical protein
MKNIKAICKYYPDTELVCKFYWLLLSGITSFKYLPLRILVKNKFSYKDFSVNQRYLRENYEIE